MPNEEQTTIEALQRVCENVNKSACAFPYTDMVYGIGYTFTINEPQWYLALYLLFFKHPGGASPDDCF
jgi:hypothetical protein